MHVDQSCVAATDAQQTPKMGHNRPPKSKVFGLKAAWLHFADDLEIRRLAKLHVRIARKEKALSELRGERSTIMNRCIRRMRRSAGLN